MQSNRTITTTLLTGGLMFALAARKITAELERLTRRRISLERALDLVEASTQNIEELIVINTMRESLQEISGSTLSTPLSFDLNTLMARQQPRNEVCYA
jgi:cell division protein FtsX